MIVYRFQNTKEIEKESYAEDIMNIWFCKGENNHDFELTEEILEEIYFEWQPFINLRLSTEAFQELTPFEWIEKIFSFTTEEGAYDFQMKHKLEGVFAIHPTDTLEEAFEMSQKSELGLGNDYLIVGEADIIEEFSYPFGLLVNYNSITKVIEVPNKLRKSKDSH